MAVNKTNKIISLLGMIVSGAIIIFIIAYFIKLAFKKKKSDTGTPQTLEELAQKPIVEDAILIPLAGGDKQPAILWQPPVKQYNGVDILPPAPMHVLEPDTYIKVQDAHLNYGGGLSSAMENKIY